MQQKLFFLMAMFVCSGSCKPVFQYKKMIENSTGIVLCQIEPEQTADAARKDSVKYINGFAVIKQYPLEESQVNALKRHLTKRTNYDTANTKRCPFIPAYVLSSDTSLFIMLSVAPCSKVLVSENGKETIFDLVNENTLEQKIAGIISPGK
jgi:hypothetical protein